MLNLMMNPWNLEISMSLLFFQSLPFILAFLLGLGLPRSFLLLFIIEAFCIWLAWRQNHERGNRLLASLSIALLCFGLSYVAAQIAWKVWLPISDHLQEVLTAAVLPALGLMGGWCLQRLKATVISRKTITLLIVAYGLGSLVYVLISLSLTQSPWWHWFDPVKQSVFVPWGSDHPLNMRSVEQRAYLILACLPAAFILFNKQETRYRAMASLLLVVFIGALIATLAFQGRIGLLILFVSALPWMTTLSLLGKRLNTLWVILAMISVLAISGRGCDERLWLQLGFLGNVSTAPWGGRLIRFHYADCNPAITNRFGSFAGSNASSPHNVLLDVYNDAGIVPAVFMLIAISPIVVCVLRSFYIRYSLNLWDWHSAVRWALFSTLLVEWLTQPLMYSDQLMFAVGFFYAGILLAEASDEYEGAKLISLES